MARILVIDDTKNIRNMVRLTLEKAGHDVELAEDGERGLELFGDGTTWDLTLVDQQMPGQQGNQVVVEARRRDPMARLIMMTAFATNELASEVLASGAFDFLRKPFTTDVLRGATEAALSHPRATATPEDATTRAVALPLPGQFEYSMPRVSWRINGFSFWPMPSSQTGAQGLEFGRVFQVRRPDGELSQCFVGIAPHIRAQAQSHAGRELSDDDSIWEQICGAALSNYIWDKAEAPPATLPVFDVPRSSRGIGSPVSWGPFGG